MRKRFLTFFVLIISFAVIFSALYIPVYKIIYPLKYEEYILKYSQEYKLNKYLVMAVIKTESNYKYNAHSGVARGLMQLTDSTARWIAKKHNIDFESSSLENPEINISMGCYYLRYLLDYYHDDASLALAAYNAGMGNVDNWLKNPEYSKDGKTLFQIPFQETKAYLLKIEKSVQIYKKLYKD